MKRLFNIILSLTLVLSLAFVVACQNKTNNTQATTKEGDKTTEGNNTTNPGGDKTFGNLEDGYYSDYKDDNTFVATRTETRQKAFTAYNPAGEKIDDYITIASAINSCVDYDVEYNSGLGKDDPQVFGSYVTKTGSTFKLFVNHQGFAKENDDQFWYYENGTSLDAYNCWDNVDTIRSIQNTDYIVTKISGFGTVSQQSWNSYRLLNAFGEEINDVSAQSWELSSTMDAAVMQFPARLAGISGLKYTIDLSDVQIIPPYDGCDNTYAFIGFYAWQDYYVIALGLACDTRTGNWHPFIGTSRDDSFSDVEYNLGKCLFTSTWKDGYFSPDAKQIDLEIGTKKLYDEEVDEYYQVDEFSLTVDGKLTYQRHITDSLLNNYFAGYPLSWENGYAFIAGLDIKNRIASNQYSLSADYFNGSEFLNLKVTTALAYVPSAEEISDVLYGYSIEESWRGKYHDILMSNTEDTAEVLDYTVLNTAVCGNYRATNGIDVYSFSYDGNNSSLSELGTNLRKYQNKIDALGELTVQDMLNDSSLLDEVGSWLVESQTIVPQKYFLLLDFSKYYEAKELFESTSMSDEAKAVVEELKALGALDYEKFDQIMDTTYKALSAEEQGIVRLVYGAAQFDSLKGLSTFIKEIQTREEKTTTYEKVLYVNGKQLTCEKNKELTVSEAFDELIFLASGIANKVNYQTNEEYKGLSDDPNTAQTAVMNGDNHFYPSMRIVHLVEFFESLDLELPQYAKDLLETIEYEDFYEGFYYPIYNTVKLAVSIKENNKTKIENLTSEELAFLNEVWTYNYIISVQISWNWNSGNKFKQFYDDRTRAIAVLAGGDVTKSVDTYFDEVGAFLVGCGYSLNFNGWGVTATEII